MANVTPQTRALIELLHDESLPNLAAQRLMEISDALDEADTRDNRAREAALELARAKVCELAELTRLPSVRQG
jgi:hypothetical protein